MPRSLDTESDAEAVQLDIYRRMTPARRVAIGIQMSLDARATVLAGIRARHPDYDDAKIRSAEGRILVSRMRADRSYRSGVGS